MRLLSEFKVCSRVLISFIICILIYCGVVAFVPDDNADSSIYIVVGFKAGLEFQFSENIFEPTADIAPATIAEYEQLNQAGRSFQQLFQQEKSISFRQSSISNELIRQRIDRWFLMEVPYPGIAESEVAWLRSFSIVEHAYILPTPIQANTASTVPNYSPRQVYLDKSPKGVNAEFAWKKKIDGDGITIAVMENDVNINHVEFDIMSNQDVVGAWRNGKDEINDHGTAVLGILKAADDGSGITGIAPEADVVVYSLYNRRGNKTTLAGQIMKAADDLKRGDIIVIPQQYEGLKKKENYIPVEYYEADFDAISYATGKGIIVVEAAGNGSQNLDSKSYGSQFDRAMRDSKAILVGAGAPDGGKSVPSRTRVKESNYGSRVDVQGLGSGVVTTGYGDLFGQAIANQRYTETFGGTSAATAIIAGATALLQGYAADYLDGEVLPPEAMRDILVRSGAAQEGNTKENIGPLPNLKKAFKLVRKWDKSTPRVVKPVDGFRWRNYSYQEIEWKGISGGQVMIDLLLNGELNYEYGAFENDGSTYVGLTPNGTGYQFKVRHTSDSKQAALSGTFEVYGSPSISSPDAGAQYKQWDVLPVRWDDDITGNNVEITIHNRDTGNGWYISESTNNDGLYEVRLPGDFETGDRFSVRVVSLSNHTGGYTPNFTVNEIIPVVTHPQSGFSWRKNTFQNTRWHDFPGAGVNVDVYQNNQRTNSFGLYENNGKAFIALSTEGSGYSVKVTSYQYTSKYDFSDSFSVAGPAVVTSPKGGDSYPLFGTINIRWDSGYYPGGLVAIFLFDLLRNDTYIIDAAAFNDGSYDLTLPLLSPVGYPMVITITSLDLNYSAFSDRFSITYVAPGEGEKAGKDRGALSDHYLDKLNEAMKKISIDRKPKSEKEESVPSKLIKIEESTKDWK